MKRMMGLLIVAWLFPAIHVAGTPTEEVGAVLDRLHDAAARADSKRYFATFAPDAVFLGTAAEERWTFEEFRAFAGPYFDAGRGWTYIPRHDERHVDIAPGGQVAWFDEALDNDKYGECRGTGVLRKIDGAWKIAQYNLMIPVPNEIATDVVAMISGLAAGDHASEHGHDHGEQAEGRSSPVPPPSPCAARDGYADLDFWIGDWNVMRGDQQVGTNRIEKILGGCAVMEHWTASDGSQGQSLFYVVLAEDVWKQVWVSGRPTSYGGVKEKRLVARLDDGSMRFQGTIVTPQGPSYLDRTTLTPLEDGRVRQLIEISRDEGASWSSAYDAVYVRR